MDFFKSPSQNFVLQIFHMIPPVKIFEKGGKAFYKKFSPKKACHKKRKPHIYISDRKNIAK